MSELFVPSDTVTELFWEGAKGSVAVDPSLAIAWIRLEGVIGVPQISSASNSGMAHPDYVAGMDTIWDFRAADLRGLAGQEMMEIRRRAALRQDQTSHRSAFVGNSDLQFGILRMWDAYGAELRQSRRIFRDIDSAFDWLLASRD